MQSNTKQVSATDLAIELDNANKKIIELERDSLIYQREIRNLNNAIVRKNYSIERLKEKREREDSFGSSY